MRIRRSASIGLLVLVVVTLVATACSSSSSRATSAFTRGMAWGFSPSGGQPPPIPAKFANCVYGMSTPADRATLSKESTQEDSNDAPDSVAIRVIRHSDACDPGLTEQLVQANIFAGAPADISSDQRSCTTTKLIAGIEALDDSKVTGHGGSSFNQVAQTAGAACGVSIGG
jgi:hypothetical protein